MACTSRTCRELERHGQGLGSTGHPSSNGHTYTMLTTYSSQANKETTKKPKWPMQFLKITKVFDRMTGVKLISENSQKFPDPLIRYKEGFGEY